jgi:hypothetical protein
MSVGRSSEEAVAGPDPSWRGLYKAGGVSGVLVGILFIFLNYLDCRGWLETLQAGLRIEERAACRGFTTAKK